MAIELENLLEAIDERLDKRFADAEKRLQEGVATAINNGRATDEHERSAAETRGAGDDPLTDERIQKQIDAQVSDAIEKAQAEHQKELDRVRAEASTLQPGAAQKTIDDLLPGIKAVAHKPVHKCSELELEAQKLHDMMYLIGKFAKAPVETAKRFLQEQGVSSDAVNKALDSYTSGSGSEWIETAFSSQFSGRVALGGRILPIFPSFQMTAKTITVPTGSGRMTAYRTTGAENTAITEDAAMTSGNVSFVAEDINIYKAYSDNLDQDAVMSAGTLLMGEMETSISEWLDIMIDNGDTADTHHDSDVTASTDPRKAWIGLREKALTNTGANVDLSTFSWDNLISIPSLMAGYNEDPEKLAWVIPTQTYWGKITTLKDSQNNNLWTNVQGRDGVDPIVRGQVAYLGGIPVTISGIMRVNLNASGAYDGSTTSKAALYCVYRDAWWFGDRKQITFETQRQAKSRSTDVVITLRGDFQHMRGTDLTTAMGYNF